APGTPARTRPPGRGDPCGRPAADVVGGGFPDARMRWPEDSDDGLRSSFLRGLRMSDCGRCTRRTMDEADRPRRRGIRLRDYDYAQPGAYMVTVCIHDRLSLLGSIDQGEATVTAGGDAVAGCWRRLPRQFGNLVLD